MLWIAVIQAAFTREVLEPFWQAADGTRAEGLGLGLALVKRLTAAHGGAVTIADCTGRRGTSVTVTLPILANSSQNEIAV